MSFTDAVAALDARTNYERSGRLGSPTLVRIEMLMDVMAHPQRTYAVLHVTGTNGKTTVARAATEVLRAAGLAVGTYTSPHVETVRERIAYDGSPITEEQFARAWDEVSPYLDLVDGKHDRPVTWFEAATALALSWFAERAVDVAVVEVGMGGTWDATNVVDASVCAVAPVSLDHVDVLGPALADIAREKAGIVKPGAVVFSSEQEPEVMDVLRARCEEVGADLRPEGPAFVLEHRGLAVAGQDLTIRLEGDRFEWIFLPVFGEHVARDAVLGAAAARAMIGGATLEHPVLAEAFARIGSRGRMEIVRRRPLVILDGAHNPSAAAAVAAAIRESFAWRRLWLVVSVMADKDVEGVLEPLVPLADEVIVTRNGSPRAATVDQMAAAARTYGKDAMSVPSVADAISVALERASDDDAVVVSGSLYTVGEARRVLVGS